MPKHKTEIPKSDFDRYEDKQKDMDESLKMGEGIYVKGGKNGKKKNSKGK